MSDRKTGLVTEVHVPAGRNALERTIRVHEACHAIGTKYKGKVNDWAIQCALDLEVHAKLWPEQQPKRMMRDLCAVALAEVRTAAKSADPVGQVYSLARAAAMASRMPSRYNRRVYSAVRKVFSTDECIVIQKAMTQARRGKIAASAELLRTLVPPPPATPIPGNKPDLTGTGKAQVELVELLPRNKACEVASNIRRARVSSGSRPNMRSVVGVLAGSAQPIFRRRIIEKKLGGTVLLDASGSMGLDDERLAEVAAAMPAAQIAYYDGNDSGHNPKGRICIVAKKGRRYTGLLPRLGGNSIDYEALQWLSRQPGPYTFICDLGFSGPNARKAGPLMRAMVAQGMKQYHSFEAWQKAKR
jgi:hypothetical protein